MNIKEIFGIGIGGFIVGFFIRLGIPDTGEILLSSWNVISEFLIYISTIDQHIYIKIIGIIILLIALYFIIFPLIEAIKFGIEGVIVLVIGFIFGFGVADYLRNLVSSTLGF